MDRNIFNKLVNAIEKSREEARNIFMQKYGYQCRQALELSIEQFYDDYTPKMYNRQEGLLKAYRINSDGTYEFDENLITGRHRINDKEYLYNLAFREGYHGGAKDGPGHPSPGIPYWRTPPHPGMMYLEEYDELCYVNRWALWGKQAVRTTPILSIVDDKIAMFDFDKKYNKILIDTIRKNTKDLLLEVLNNG
jgi:hypothetical protein